MRLSRNTDSRPLIAATFPVTLQLTSNQAAFLSTVADSEGTARSLDAYRVCYRAQPPKASHIIVSFADHPAITGEWDGEPLDHLGASYVGLKSTAAGRYQIIKHTWMEAKLACRLSSFNPDSQDLAALWLIKSCGALTAVNMGNVAQAVQLCSNQWASFTNSNAPGQPHQNLAFLLDAFAQAGGKVMPA